MYYKGPQINNSQSNEQHATNFTPEKKKVILEHLLITKNSTAQTKNYSHVPCKFYKQGNCSAGPSCPFSHSMDFKEANKRPCKYFKLGNCKFGNKCANSHILTSPISSSGSSGSSSGLGTPSNTPTGYFPSNNTSTQYKQFLTGGGTMEPPQASMDETEWLPRTPITNNNTLTSATTNNNDTMRNYLYQLPSRKPLQQQNYSLTPPLSSSSSCSSASSSSIFDPSFQSPLIPRHFNTLYSNGNITNNNNSTTTPIMFNSTREEYSNPNKNYYPEENNNSTNYYFNYSSILKTLEEDEEEEEHFQTNFQNSNKNDHYQNNYNQYLFLNQPSQSETSTSSLQNQHFRFDDL